MLYNNKKKKTESLFSRCFGSQSNEMNQGWSGRSESAHRPLLAPSRETDFDSHMAGSASCSVWNTDRFEISSVSVGHIEGEEH